jgi:hypothetical protein
VLFLLADLYRGRFDFMTSWSLSVAYDQKITTDVLSSLAIEDLTFSFWTRLAEHIPGSQTWVLNYAVVCWLVWLVRKSSGLGSSVYSLDGLVSRRRGGALVGILGSGMLSQYWITAITAVWNSSTNWMAVVFPLLLAIPVWAHRRAVETVLRDRFRAETFEQQPRDVLTGPAWLREIGKAIEREQHSKMILYDPDRPFVGLGEALESWSLVMDLCRKPGVDSEPLTATDVLNCVRERLTDLSRLPAPSSGLDRLRGVEIDELVYLPSGPPRSEVNRGETAVETHLRASVGEGGEARRHFLRVQVRAWEDQVVVSVLVQVHTQGELLVLEAAPYVQGPLGPEFGLVDAVIERSGAFPVSSAARALLTAPAGGVAAVFSVARSVGGMAIWMKRRYRRVSVRGALSKGAAASVRELASDNEMSEFQRMDAIRYLKTIHERIATGVLQVVKGKGYDTGQLEQQVVQVSNGGVFVGAMSGGAVATGRGASARGAGSRGARALKRMVISRSGR